MDARGALRPLLAFNAYVQKQKSSRWAALHIGIDILFIELKSIDISYLFTERRDHAEFAFSGHYLLMEGRRVSSIAPWAIGFAPGHPAPRMLAIDRSGP